MPRTFLPTRRHLGTGWVVRNLDRTATFACRCGTVSIYRRRRDAVRAARRHYHGAGGQLQPAPTRRGRWLAAVFVLLAALAFAATVEALTGLTSRAAPAPAPPTTIITAVAPGYVPVPAGPPPGEPAAAASPGGGR